MLYRMYVTEAVKNINESVSRAYTGTYMKMSWYDLLQQKPAKEETAQEIIERIGNGLEKLGGE